MKLILERVTLAKVEVDLPDHCPECGEPFGEASELVLPFREEGWGGTSQDVRLGVHDGEWQVEDAGVSEDNAELSIRTGLRCNACEKLIACTEDSRGREDEIARAAIPMPGWVHADPWAALEAIQKVMFPDGDHDHECGSDALGSIANILTEAGL